MFLTNNLTIFPEFTNYLQISPGIVSYFFPHIGEVKHIPNMAPLTSLSSFISPFCKIQTPFIPIIESRRHYWKNIISPISLVVFTDICVPLFYFSVTWSSEMHFSMIYLKTRGGKQPYVAFSTLEFHSCFSVFGSVRARAHTHSTESLTLHKCLLCLVSSLFSSSWMELVFLVLWSKC